MNQIIAKLFVMLEKHSLINEEVSGFRFLNSAEFAKERNLFFNDLSEQLCMDFDENDVQKINNLADLITYVSQHGSAFHA